MIDVNENETLWVEKYRPKIIDQCILKDSTKQEFHSILDEGKIPNLLLFGPPGTGKTTAARALCNELELDYMIINASNERGLDVIRERINSFASTVSMSGNGKCFILDECLEENEEVRVGTVNNWVPVKLKDMLWGVEYPVVSFNMETGEFENDLATIVSEKEDDLYEVELEDGSSVKVNPKHPFVVVKDGIFYEKSLDDGLNGSDRVVVHHNISSQIYSITYFGYGNVRNLTVTNNHTFVTANGIVTHNCDHLLPHTQAALRSATEEFSRSCSFVMTANYPNRIIPALHSRFVGIDFGTTKKETENLQAQLFMRLLGILDYENVKYDDSVIITLIQKFFPDNRKIIGLLQQYGRHGKIDEGVLMNLESVSIDNMIKAVKNKKFKDIVQWAEDSKDNDTSSMYERVYLSLKEWIEPKSIPDAIMILQDYQKSDAIVPSKELHLVAMCTEMMTSLDFRS